MATLRKGVEIVTTIDKRVEWFSFRTHGDRCTELFIVIAERDEAGWRFFEKSLYDWAWFGLETTPSLVETAEKMTEEMSQKAGAA